MKKQLREEVYNKYEGYCAYCGDPITYKDFQIDHIIPKRNGGLDEISNLNPSCKCCNHYKRGDSIESFRKKLLTLNERIEKIYINKVGKKYCGLRFNKFCGAFYYEQDNYVCRTLEKAIHLNKNYGNPFILHICDKVFYDVPEKDINDIKSYILNKRHDILRWSPFDKIIINDEVFFERKVSE